MLSDKPFNGYIAGPTGSLGFGRYEGDPYWSSVVLAMHMDGADNGTTFTDVKGHTVTRGGTGMVTSTAQSKFGGASAYTANTGYLTLDGSSDFAFPGDFTVECWFRTTDLNNTQLIYDTRPNGTDNDSYFMLYFESADDTIRFNIGGGGGTLTSSAISADTWYHIAVARSGTTIKLFLDGVQQGTSLTKNTSYLIGASRPAIGVSGYSGFSEIVRGYIDDLRVTKGVARYTSGFSVPTAAFPESYAWTGGPDTTPTAVVTAYSVISTPAGSMCFGGDPYWNNVVLAMHMDGADNGTTFTDLTGKTISRTGVGIVTKTAVSKFGGASTYFPNDGAQYLSSPGSVDFNFGTGDFTVEGWVYIAGNSADYGVGVRRAVICSTWTSSSGGWTFFIDGNGTTTGNGLWFGNGTPGETNWSCALTVTQGAWHHIAFSRTSTQVYFALDGAIVSQQAVSSSYAIGTVEGTLNIGRQNPASGWEFPLNGYIDDLRITKGVARYTSSYSVPTAAFSGGTDTNPSLSIFASITLSPPSTGITINGQATVVSEADFIDVGTGALTLDGQAVTVEKTNYEPAVPLPDVGVLALTGQTPYSVVTTYLQPPTGSVGFTGSTGPTFRYDFAPYVSTYNTQFAGQVPVVGGDHYVPMNNGAVTVYSTAPTVGVTYTLATGAYNLALTSEAPTLTVRQYINLSIGSAGVTSITAYAPDVIIMEIVPFDVESAAVAITSEAPLANIGESARMTAELPLLHAAFEAIPGDAWRIDGYLTRAESNLTFVPSGGGFLVAELRKPTSALSAQTAQYGALAARLTGLTASLYFGSDNLSGSIPLPSLSLSVAYAFAGTAVAKLPTLQAEFNVDASDGSSATATLVATLTKAQMDSEAYAAVQGVLDAALRLPQATVTGVSTSSGTLNGDIIKPQAALSAALRGSATLTASFRYGAVVAKFRGKRA